MQLLRQRFIRKEDLVLRKVAGETILVPVKNSTVGLESVYTLNEVGGAIWTLLDGRTGAEIAAELCRRYDTDDASAARDVERFLTLLHEAGLIDMTNTPGEGD